MTEEEIIHHRDENRQNNDLSNLQLVDRSKHRAIHNIGNKYGQGHYHRRGKHQDTSDRQCFKCGSKTTAIRKPDGIKNKTSSLRWYHLKEDRVNWYCQKCFDKATK